MWQKMSAEIKITKDNFEEAQELLESLGCEDYMFILIKKYKY